MGAQHTPGRWKASKGLREHSSGARVVQTQTTRARHGYWKAYLPDGSPLRCDRLPNGLEYTPRPWHDAIDMPPPRRFASAKHAMKVVEAAIAKARGEEA